LEQVSPTWDNVSSPYSTTGGPIFRRAWDRTFLEEVISLHKEQMTWKQKEITHSGTEITYIYEIT
jgi:hypothetical protein